MTNNDRQANADQYLIDIDNAINSLIRRCGGYTENHHIPHELICHQRSLFVHSGIIGVLSMAIMENNYPLIRFFDYLLGYYINRKTERQDELTVAMITSLHDQIDEDRRGDSSPTSVAFLDTLKLATIALSGHMSPDDVQEIHEFVTSIALRCIGNIREQDRRDSQKN